MKEKKFVYKSEDRTKITTFLKSELARKK